MKKYTLAMSDQVRSRIGDTAEISLSGRRLFVSHGQKYVESLEDREAASLKLDGWSIEEEGAEPVKVSKAKEKGA